MLKIRIIPCLDVKDGRVVKGINFLNLIDAGDPVEQAHFYSTNGADEICFLDISASIEKRTTLLKIVEKTAEKVFVLNRKWLISLRNSRLCFLGWIGY